MKKLLKLKKLKLKFPDNLNQLKIHNIERLRLNRVRNLKV